MKSIDIIIKQDGTVTVEAIGFKGNACIRMTEALELALGLDKRNRKKKPEFYQTETDQQRLKA